jgi:predicted transcriptional regulator of viral defense system
LLTEYRKRGYVDRVRRDLWVALSLEDGQPVASRYRIATAISPSAHVSHHSAFEYHGYANQVSYEVCVTSESRFAPFDYDGLNYRWFSLSPPPPRLRIGVVTRADGVAVTDLERTIVDSINDMEKVGGLEDLLSSLDLIPRVESAPLLSYLLGYDKHVLYQKVGYLLSLFNGTLRLPKSFFAECRSHIGKSVRYLVHDLPDGEKTYDRSWQLVVPRRPLAAPGQGVG